MILSQKTLYALRALFELAKRNHQGPIKLPIVSKAQAIPLRFLEVIMGELRQAKFVVSKRGKLGGYMFAREPKDLTIGEIISFIEGEIRVVDCTAGSKTRQPCVLRENCVFIPLWEDVRKSISSVIDKTSFQQLIEMQKRVNDNITYSI